jgi:hypothetical protein
VLTAAENGNSDTVKWLLGAVDPTQSKDPFDNPINNAARGGRLDTILMLIDMGFDIDENTSWFAASGGSLNVLEWYHTRVGGWGGYGGECLSAAEEGHLETLQWLRANGCQWGNYVCDGAAEGGHLNVLQWARANGCPCNLDTVCVKAAEGGHLNVLQWARAEGGHLNMLQWAPRDRG